jgi:hypothetical protein
MSTIGRTLVTSWFPWVLGAHWILVVGGTLGGPWLLAPLCLWTESRVLQVPGGIIWLVLTLSPLLGLLALKVRKLRGIYAGFAIATPLYFIIVWSLLAADITICDAP